MGQIPRSTERISSYKKGATSSLLIVFTISSFEFHQKIKCRKLAFTRGSVTPVDYHARLRGKLTMLEPYHKLQPIPELKDAHALHLIWSEGFY